MPKRQIRQTLERGDAAKMSRKIRELVKFWQVTAIADPHRIKRHENEQPPPPTPPPPDLLLMEMAVWTMPASFSTCNCLLKKNK